MILGFPQNLKINADVNMFFTLLQVRCPGCDKFHLVADHLGWFGDRGFNIEKLAQEQGECENCRDQGGGGEAG